MSIVNSLAEPRWLGLQADYDIWQECRRLKDERATIKQPGDAARGAECETF